jgi:hypothetical protein
VNTYLAGSLVRVATYTGTPDNPAGGFRDENGDLADPTAVTLTYRPGTGQQLVTVTYPDTPVERDGTGLYHADLDTTPATASSPWTYEWTGTGAVQAPAANAFIVDVPYL